MKGNWIEVPFLHGRLSSEINSGFQKISQSIQLAKYIPTKCKKEIISDLVITYKIESNVYELESNRYIGFCEITILKEYKEETKENIYTLIDYKEQMNNMCTEKNIGE